ncbi:hypothetical protein GF386_04690 [Candidatus Pacearchaeota archaeon]|nr:hypothetical protein [Candidatus Pacearchaeota archaeon]MBD3283414.1 hypothetical protein [Candidatus Pacearchaeota archaeon]
MSSGNDLDEIVDRPYPSDPPITRSTIIENLRWGVRRHQITPEYAEKRIAELEAEERADLRRTSYNPFSRLYQAVLDTGKWIRDRIGFY